MSDTAQKVKFNYNKIFLHYFYCLGIIALLTLTSFNLNKFLENQKVLGASVDATSLQDEKSYWQKIISDNPTFEDGYLQIAKVDVELGNTSEARIYLEKVKSFDPNSSKISEVRQVLGL